MKNVLTLGQMLSVHARLHPNRMGARDLERAMTFQQWNARACRLANALLGLGLSKGDRVAVLAYNTVERVPAYSLTTKSRGAFRFHSRLRKVVGKEICYIIDDSEASALIVASSSARWRKSAPNCPCRQRVEIWFGAGRCPAGYAPYEDLMARARDSRPEIEIAAATHGC